MRHSAEAEVDVPVNTLRLASSSSFQDGRANCAENPRDSTVAQVRGPRPCATTSRSSSDQFIDRVQDDFEEG